LVDENADGNNYVLSREPIIIKMLYPKQLITFFKNTLQSLSGQQEKSDSSLPIDTVDDERLYVSTDSRKDVHVLSNQNQFPAHGKNTESERSQPVDHVTAPGPNDDSEQIPSEDLPVKHDDAHPENSSGSTDKERFDAGKYTRKQLELLAQSLTKVCRESDPQFVDVGRKLTIVTRDVKKLTDTVHSAVNLMQNEEEGNASLKTVESLVQEIFSALSNDKEVIDKNVIQVKNLVSQIFKCDRLREMIDRINTLFRIVRINIRIQCSAQSLADEMFEDVSDDLEHLAKKLHHVTRQILKDVNQGAKSLTNLQKSITLHIKDMDEVLVQAKSIISKAFYDIRQLMHGTETMIREADSISKKVAEKVGEVVVGIQFHDSLSQRVEHIVHAFEDIGAICGNEEETATEEQLGTAFIIIDLQLRQLIQLSKEIKLVREQIEADFLSIESEVEGLGSILHDTQFRAVGPQQFLSTLFSSLEVTLKNLTSLLTEGKGMVQQIENAASETREIADNLLELRDNVSEIREETRVQAVNTIIMASTLGNKGKTIEVLAKEIQTLSDKSSVLADDVEAMQLAVDQAVSELMGNTVQKEKYLSGNNLEEEIGSVKKSFREIIAVVTELTGQIEKSAKLIKDTRSSLVFLDQLENKLDFNVSVLNTTRDKLSVWKDKGTHNTEEIEQLVERYSMAQERMIHRFDQVDVSQETADDEDVFF